MDKRTSFTRTNYWLHFPSLLYRERLRLGHNIPSKLGRYQTIRNWLGFSTVFGIPIFHFQLTCIRWDIYCGRAVKEPMWLHPKTLKLLILPLLIHQLQTQSLVNRHHYHGESTKFKEYIYTKIHYILPRSSFLGIRILTLSL